MRLRDRKAWKVLLALMLVFSVISVMMFALFGWADKSYTDKHNRYLTEAQAAGYPDSYAQCDMLGIVDIDGTEYRIYHSHRDSGIFGYSQMVYIRSDAGFIDNTGGKATDIRIYCKNISVNDEYVIVEPYSMWCPLPSAVTWMFVIIAVLSAVAAVGTLFALMIYLIVYHIGSRRSG